MFHVDVKWKPRADIQSMTLQELEHEHIQLLIRDLKQGKIVLFTGAGLFSAAGLPNWRDLLLLLIDRYERQSTDARCNSAQVRANLFRFLMRVFFVYNSAGYTPQ
jgi:hypothetical protein